MSVHTSPVAEGYLAIIAYMGFGSRAADTNEDNVEGNYMCSHCVFM